MTTAGTGAAVVAGSVEEATPRPRVRRRLRPAHLGLVPFGVYIVLFLVVPTVLAVATGFFDKAGRFTLDNVSALADPVILTTFWNSTWLSLLTAGVVVESHDRGRAGCFLARTRRRTTYCTSLVARRIDRRKTRNH